MRLQLIRGLVLSALCLAVRTIPAQLPLPVLEPVPAHSRNRSVDRRQWYEALEDVLARAGDFDTLHILCAFPEVCLQGNRWIGAMDRLPHTLWNATDPQEPLLSVRACGQYMHEEDLVLLVAPSNETAIQLVQACRSNSPRYIVAWPYDGAGPELGPWNALGKAFTLHRLRIVSMDIPVVDDNPTGAADPDPVFFYRIEPYAAQSPCRVRVTVQVAVWQRGLGFVGDLPPRLFPLGPPSNFRGCTVQMAVRQYAPFIFLDQRDPPSESEVTSPTPTSTSTELSLDWGAAPAPTPAVPGRWEPRGQWVPLLRALEYGMNVHFNYTPMPDTGSSRLASSKLPFDMYMLRTVPSSQHLTDVPQTSRSSCYTICVPRRWRQTSIWRALLGEFSAIVWINVLATFYAIRVLLTLGLVAENRRQDTRQDRRRRGRGLGHRGRTGRRMHRNDVSFLLIAAALGSVQPTTPGHGKARSNSRERSLFAMWLFFAVIMNTAYQAVQHSLRTAPQLQDSLRTLEELAQSDVKLHGPKLAAECLAEAPGGSALLKRFSAYNFSGITGVTPNADDAYFCTGLEWGYLESKLGRDKAGRPKHAPIDRCLIRLPEAFFALPVGSYFLDKASDVVLRMTEAGITGHIVGPQNVMGQDLDHGVRIDGGAEADRPRPENLERMRSALLVLGFGLGASTMVFVVELSRAQPRGKVPQLASTASANCQRALPPAAPTRSPCDAEGRQPRHKRVRRRCLLSGPQGLLVATQRKEHGRGEARSIWMD